jgi:hypothetical protein
VTLRLKLPFTQVMTYTATIDCSLTWDSLNKSHIWNQQSSGQTWEIRQGFGELM